MLDDLPIFPLGTVLFPGGVLPLRVFEARYMDMVRDCMHRSTPFGVCLITRGREVGEAAEHETTGCLARIIDWDMEQLGVLQLRTRGAQRFSVLERRVQADGLVRARVEPLDDDPLVPVPPEHQPCAVLARRVVEDLVKRETDERKRLIAEPYAFDAAGWVANRLAEFLPIPLAAKQKLMALDEPIVRLSLVHQFLKGRGVL